ncbi:MAG: T9SS type A sorting domain-containing protein [Flavobacteriales bacterium]|nr:T9SS type A sorting domain-containing protein [Flavobacteriales bacterium]
MIKFVSHGCSPQIFLHDKARASYVLRDLDASMQDTLHRLDMKPAGAYAQEPEPVAVVLKDVTHHYYYPQCPDGISVPGYNRIVYEDVFPRIDFHYYGASSGQRFSIVCRPGSDPDDIKLLFTGQDSISEDIQGFLKLHFDSAFVTLPYAVAYQLDNADVPVPLGWLANFNMDGQDGLVGLHFDTYDTTKPLMLQIGGLPPAGGGAEPDLAWSTLIGSEHGGGATEFMTAGDADEVGNLYVAGNTRDGAFPANTGTTDHQGNHDITFGRFLYLPDEPEDAILDYMTFFGGAGNDKPTVLQFVEQGEEELLYVAGWTSSSNLPPRPNDNPNDGTYYQNTLKGATDGFIIRAEASTGLVPRATYFGGEGDEMITGFTEDADHAVYIVGATNTSSGTLGTSCIAPASGFPLCQPSQLAYFQGANAGGTDSFILKIDPTFELLWSTFWGGSGDDRPYDAAYMPSLGGTGGGNDRIAIVGSSTGTLPFQVNSGYYVGANAEETGAIYTFDSNGRARWGTFIPGVTRLEAVVNDKAKFVVMGMTKLQANTTLSCQPSAGQLSICTLSGAYQDDYVNRHDTYFGEFVQPNGDLIWSTAYGDVGWLGAIFPDNNSGPDYYKQQQSQPFDIYRFSDLECDALSNVYAMGLFQHGYWEIDDDQTTVHGFGLYNQPWNPLTGSDQTDLTLFQFGMGRQLLWASLFGGMFEHQPDGTSGLPFDLQWYMKGCDFGHDLALVPGKALYWMGTSGGVALPEACPVLGTSWCEESLTSVGDNLDMMQGFATRMNLRDVSIGLVDQPISPLEHLHAVPNPTSDFLRLISHGKPFVSIVVTVVNSLGQPVLVARTNGDGLLDVSGLAAGCYSVHRNLASGEVHQSARFVRL